MKSLGAPNKTVIAIGASQHIKFDIDAIRDQRD